MFQNSFTDKDEERLVEFLNFVSDKAKFELDVKEVIQFFGLLAWAQNELKAKVHSNIAEVKRVVEAEKPKPAAKAKKAK